MAYSTAKTGIQSVTAVLLLIIMILMCGCSGKNNRQSENDPSSASATESGTAAAMTSIAVVTDENGTVTDGNGNAVTVIVTGTPQSVDKNPSPVADSGKTSVSTRKESTDKVATVTSYMNTVVAKPVTVTNGSGNAVTDSHGTVVTTMITTVSTVVVAIPDPEVTTIVTGTVDVVAVTTTTTATVTTTTTTTTTQQIIKVANIDYPISGECFGTVSIPVANIEMDLYMGDNDRILRKGIGLYYGSYIPGFEKKSLMCGHNSVGYLSELVTYSQSHSVIGEKIYINTTYGDFVYEIYKSEILDCTDMTYVNASYDESTVVLYSCVASTYTNDRVYFVAKKVSGPVIVR